MTTSKERDGMGFTGTPEYRRFLKTKPGTVSKVVDIPEPPGGKRDSEVEDLLRNGRMREARELLQVRLEEAREAPIGRDAAIARVAFYSNLLNKK